MDVRILSIYRNNTYNLVNCDKFPISFGIFPDSLFSLMSLNNCMKLKFLKWKNVKRKIKNYNVINCDKFPISFGMFPDILLEFKDLNSCSIVKKKNDGCWMWEIILAILLIVIIFQFLSE